MLKKLTALFLASLLLAGALASCGKSGEGDETTTDTSAVTTKAEPFVPGEDVNAEAVSVTSENYTLTNADMSYLFYANYGNVLYELEQSGFSPSMVGLDTAASLKSQECIADSEGRTWFVYIMDAAKAEAVEMLSLCEAAMDAGISLNDKELSGIEEAMEEIKAAADAQKITLEEAVQLMYGPSVKPENVKKMLEITVLSAKYVDEIVNGSDVSDAALEAKYQEYKNKYESFDYVAYGYDYTDMLSEGADEAAKQAAIDATNKYIEDIQKCTDKESFLAEAKKHMIEALDITEDEAEQVMGQLVSTKVNYTGSGEIPKWASEAEVGDVKLVVEEEGVASVYLLTAKNTRNEEELIRSVRHILFMNTTYETDEKVNEVYNQWIADGATVEDFKDLAAEYSEDPGSASSGGLYDDVYEGQMVEEFDAWLFDEARQPGDHAIVESAKFGWHIMYYEGKTTKWKSDMKSIILDEKYNSTKTEAKDKYAVEFNDDILATIPA